MDWFTLALISAVLSAAASILEKKSLFTYDALEFSFILSAFNLLFSLPFFFYVDYSALTTSALLVLFVKSVMGVLAFWCVMLALKNLEISGALPLMVLTPGLVAFLAFLFLGESLSPLEIAGMFLLLSGTYILEMKVEESILHPFRVFMNSKSHHYILFALLLFTATSLLDKALLSRFKMTPYSFMAFQQLFFVLIFIAIFLFKNRSLRINPSLFSVNWYILALIGIFTIGYRYTQIESVKIAPVALVLSVKRISVFIAAIGGGRIFREQSLLKKAIATIILIAGAVLILDE